LQFARLSKWAANSKHSIKSHAITSRDGMTVFFPFRNKKAKDFGLVFLVILSQEVIA
jgi:hypothetical protein